MNVCDGQITANHERRTTYGEDSGRKQILYVCSLNKEASKQEPHEKQPIAIRFPACQIGERWLLICYNGLLDPTLVNVPDPVEVPTKCIYLLIGLNLCKVDIVDVRSVENPRRCSDRCSYFCPRVFTNIRTNGTCGFNDIYNETEKKCTFIRLFFADRTWIFTGCPCENQLAY